MAFRNWILAAALSVGLTAVGVAAFAQNPAYITGPAAAVQQAYPMIGTLEYEEARVYFVDAGGQIMKVSSVTQRMRSGIYYIPWELALGGQAPEGTARVYMVHNHPGGNPMLSEADIELGSFWAAKAAERGLVLDLIAFTASGEYTSLRESGQLRPAPRGLGAVLDYAGYIVQPGAGMVGARLEEAVAKLLGSETGR